MPIAIRVSLEKDYAGGVLGGIGCNGKGGGKIWEVEDWLQQEEGFESVERSLACRGPIPREVFLGEVNKRLGG